MSDKYLLKCEHLNKCFTDGVTKLNVLNDINFFIEAGVSVSIMGSSGSGKSTLLHILAGLDKPTSGAVYFENQQFNKTLNDAKLCEFRNKNLGFVYQFHHLLPEFTALENILMPLIIAGKVNKDSLVRANILLKKLGLLARAKHYPAKLSGGERQRVAVARALINTPKIILADEPTGNLDHQSGKQVLDLLLNLQSEYATSLIIVTHDKEIAECTQKQYKLIDGVLIAIR